MKQNFYLPAEWEEQSGVQLTWPHAGTDWAHMLKEVQSCFIEIAKEISKREKLLIVAPDVENVKKQICKKINTDNIRFSNVKQTILGLEIMEEFLFWIKTAMQELSTLNSTVGD